MLKRQSLSEYQRSNKVYKILQHSTFQMETSDISTITLMIYLA